QALLLRGAEAPGAVVARVLTHRGDANARSTVRCVDEAAAADVDADVARAVEEDEVAGPERPARDAAAVREIGPARVRQPDAEMPVDEADEPRAVEPGARARAAIAVRDPDEVARVRDDAVTERRCRVSDQTAPRLGRPDDPRRIGSVPLRRADCASLERAHEGEHQSEGDGERQYEEADRPHESGELP